MVPIFIIHIPCFFSFPSVKPHNEEQLKNLVDQLHPDNCLTATEDTEASNEVVTCASFEVFED